MAEHEREWMECDVCAKEVFTKEEADQFIHLCPACKNAFLLARERFAEQDEHIFAGGRINMFMAEVIRMCFQEKPQPAQMEELLTNIKQVEERLGEKGALLDRAEKAVQDANQCAELAHNMLYRLQECEKYVVELGGSVEEAKHRGDVAVVKKAEAYQARMRAKRGE